MPTQHDQNSRNGTNSKQYIRPFTARFYPGKTIIGEKKSRFNVQFFNPAIHPKPDHTGKYQQAKKNTENRQRCSSRIFIKINFYSFLQIHIVPVIPNF